MDPSLASYVESREHYVMWQPDSSGVGGYARIGRFAAPYGLRLADHTAYVRRYLGYNLLEETYGASGGWLGDAVEVHATAFVYDPIQYASRHEVGGAAMLELHPDDRYVIGASARAGIGLAGASTRFESGIHTKLWLEDAKLLVQGEADGVREVFDGGGGRWQLAAYTGPVFIPTRGVYTGLAYEAFAEDLHVRGVTRHAADAWASWFVRAHFEIMLSGRAQLVGPGERAYLGMLQLHYTL
jgi:hypothetical protein